MKKDFVSNSNHINRKLRRTTTTSRVHNENSLFGKKRKITKRDKYLARLGKKELPDYNPTNTDNRIAGCLQPDGSFGIYSGGGDSNTLCPPGYFSQVGRNFVMHNRANVQPGETGYDYEGCICVPHNPNDPASGRGNR